MKLSQHEFSVISPHLDCDRLDELLASLKLRELVEDRIEGLKRLRERRLSQNEPTGLVFQSLDELQKLLDESKC